MAGNEFIPIRVDITDHSGTSRVNEERQLFPHPSRGQVCIRQESVSEEITMNIYDLNGRLQKSDILRESLNVY
jgi:hypothetical protein